MARLLSLIERRGLENIRLHRGDAVDVIDRLPDASLTRVYLLAHPGFRGDGATIASTSAVSSAFPRFLALCTNWKNAR